MKRILMAATLAALILLATACATTNSSRVCWNSDDAEFYLNKMEILLQEHSALLDEVFENADESQKLRRASIRATLASYLDSIKHEATIEEKPGLASYIQMVKSIIDML